jgi:hypothetical protein
MAMLSQRDRIAAALIPIVEDRRLATKLALVILHKAEISC